MKYIVGIIVEIRTAEPGTTAVATTREVQDGRIDVPHLQTLFARVLHRATLKVAENFRLRDELLRKQGSLFSARASSH